jgi:hypothetical protein
MILWSGKEDSNLRPLRPEPVLKPPAPLIQIGNGIYIKVLVCNAVQQSARKGNAETDVVSRSCRAGVSYGIYVSSATRCNVVPSTLLRAAHQAQKAKPHGYPFEDIHRKGFSTCSASLSPKKTLRTSCPSAFEPSPTGCPMAPSPSGTTSAAEHTGTRTRFRFGSTLA